VITLEKSKPAQTTTVAKTDSGKNDPVVTVPAAQTQAQTQDIASAQTTQSPVLGGHAESIAVAPSYIIRDVTPVGGVTAINPKPAPIAYAQGAEGTTAFEVAVDERGTPTKCTITKGSGYASLDVAVCKAAMGAKYTPRTVNGKPVASVYRDAFTFRNNNNGDQLIPE
jgi:TonB family protein